MLAVTAAEMAKFSPELVTIYTGADTSENETAVAEGVMTDAMPDAETSVLEGGQPVYYFMISAE